MRNKAQHNINTKVEELIKNINPSHAISAKDKELLLSYEPDTGQDRLYSFFTPDYICKIMVDLAVHYGFKQGGNVLEPACGNGRMFQHLTGSNVYGFEINPINYQIAQILNPHVHLYNQYFETAFLKEPRFTTKLKNKTTWLDGYPFDLVIGNPPYGQHKNRYSSYFGTEKMKQLETFFMYKSIQLLKPGGLLVFITSQSFIRNNNKYLKEKAIMAEITEIVDAYRSSIPNR